MGQVESRKTCAQCGLSMEPIPFVRSALAGPRDQNGRSTRCFYTRSEHPPQITRGFSVDTDGKGCTFSFNHSVQMQEGEKLYKYFLHNTDTNYYCSKCFAMRFPEQARSVLLDLCGKGTVVTADMEILKMSSK